MNINYQVESYADVQEEMRELTIDHYEDDPRRACAELDVDWDVYAGMEEAGAAILITVRDDDTLIGYLSLVLAEHHHNKGFVYASADALYISREYRGQAIASNLIEETEAVLKAAGVSWLNLPFRDGDLAANIVEKLGYEKTEVVFGKSLGDI